MPTAAGTNRVEPPSGISPMFTNASPKKADSDDEHEVAGERERGADARRRPVHGGDHGLLEPPHAGDDRVVDLVQLLAHVGTAVVRVRVEARLEVGSGGEGAPGAR